MNEAETREYLDKYTYLADSLDFACQIKNFSADFFRQIRDRFDLEYFFKFYYISYYKQISVYPFAFSGTPILNYEEYLKRYFGDRKDLWSKYV